MFRSMRGIAVGLVAAQCLLPFAAASADDGQCVNGGGKDIPCGTAPPPDPCANRRCEDFYEPPPVPPALPGYTQAYRNELGLFSRYFDTSYFMTAPDAQTEGELSARLNAFFDYTVGIGENRGREASQYADRARYLVLANSALANDIASYRANIAERGIKNAALEARALPAERLLAALETQAQQLKAATFYAHNDFKVKRTLLSYFAVFGRNPSFLRKQREDGLAEYTEAERNWRVYDKSRYTPPPAAAGLAAARASEAMPLAAGRAKDWLDPNAAIDVKLAHIRRLEGRFIAAEEQRRAAKDQIARLTPENTSLSAQKDRLAAASAALETARAALERRLAITETYTPLAESNRKTAAVALGKEVMISFAKEEAIDRVKAAVDGLLGASGVTSAIPTSAEDLVERAARESRRVLIPAAGYKAQWDAFIKVQKQTATLVKRTEGYVQEAARLCAQGTPTEIAAHIKKVFSHVENEAADYTLSVGFSDLPDEEAGIFEKALGKFLDARKAATQ